MCIRSHLITGYTLNMEILNNSGCASSPDPNARGSDLSRCTKNCIFCPDVFNPSTAFNSTVTNETFRFDASSIVGKPCLTENVVYLVTCALCNIQYVGETTQKLKKRFDGHRGCINRHETSPYIYTHFLRPGHTYHHCKVQLIYHFGNRDGDVTKTLLTVEEYYMRKLGTCYPFGLNDKITSKNINLTLYNSLDFHKLNTPFFSFPSERRGRSHGHRKNSKTHKEQTDVLATIDSIYDLYESFTLHELYILLRSMSHAFIEDCLKNVIAHTTNHPRKGTTVRLILLAFRSQYIVAPNSDDDFVYCSIPYVHSAIEDIGFDKLFKHKDIVSLLPLAASECAIRTTFSYGPTIGRKLFNYNRVLKDLSNRDIKKLKCDCESRYVSRFFDTT